MIKRKALIFYVAVMGIFSLLIYLIIHRGSRHELASNDLTVSQTGISFEELFSSLLANFEHPLSILLLQIVTIILTARLLSWLCKKIGQPSVIGEIVAGIALGPSLLGSISPLITAHLFPAESLSNLHFLSQFGLIFFMFMVGMELDMSTIKRKANDAFVISQISIIVPFALGIGLAYFLYRDFAQDGINFLSFALFVGIAMSITAFPVLARIVQERGIHKTSLGSIVITCAAVDDITAWCLLAAVIAIVKAGSLISSAYIILLSIGYVWVMIKFVRPFLSRIGKLHPSRENLSKSMVAIFFITLLLSAYATEIIGIHALFGAFMAGTIMPDNMKFRNLIIEKIEDVALILLLPLFFVFTGLRTEIGLLNDPSLWLITALIILVAITGKFIGSAIAARFVGQNWHDSLTIGALMNTRGLMELVVLNIGYDLGVITPEMFAMMVIMALVTTFMTGPALDAIRYFSNRQNLHAHPAASHTHQFKVLISFAHPDRGRNLLRIAHHLVSAQKSHHSITVMHLSPENEVSPFNIDEYERTSFLPLIEESKLLNQNIQTLFKVSNNVDADIVDTANKEEYNLLLVGVGQSIYEGSLLGRLLGFSTRVINPDHLISKVTGKEKLFDNLPFEDRTRYIVSRTNCNVGILIDKGFSQCKQLIVPLMGDSAILPLLARFVSSGNLQVTILADAFSMRPESELKNELNRFQKKFPTQVTIQTNAEVAFLKKYDLALISLDTWKKMVEEESLWIAQLPSMLIVKNNQNEH